MLAVFESFTPSRFSLTLQEIADSIELPKSTAFRIVQSLEAHGYLVRREDRTYCLSFRFARLAGLVMSTLDIREIARPVMTALAERSSETVALHTVIAGKRACVDAVESSHLPLRTVIQPGEQIPLQAGSASKTLLAFMPEEELRAVLPSIAKFTRRSQRDWHAELARIRDQGYAVSHGERLAGLSAISAPIRDAREEVRYCITVNGPSVRMTPRERELVRLVRTAAADISRQYGGSVGPIT